MKNLFKVTISIIQNTSKTLWVPHRIYKLLDNPNHIDFQVSINKITVTCCKGNDDNKIFIPKYIAQQMGLSDKLITNLIVHNNQIHLGPVIGVFVSNGRVRKAKKQHIHFRFIEMVKGNQEANAILYFFSVKDVDFKNQRIYGTHYNKNVKKFEEKSFPYPDILYDRGGGTLKSQKIISQRIRNELNKTAAPLKINSRYFFDKWDVYNHLVKDKEMSSYSPKSILYNSQNDLIDIFKLNSTIYIKSCYGNNSNGIARVTRAENSSSIFRKLYDRLISKKFSNSNFELMYSNNKILTKYFYSFDQLINELNRLFQNSKAILQEEIDVIKVDGCNIDLRTEVQRNSEGKIELGPYMVRKGNKANHVTSTRSGGLVYSFDDFFRNKLNYSDKTIAQIKERISKFLLKSFNAIESIYGPFGEIGIDFAIDNNLNIWFIECNAKPGKDTIYLVCDNNTIYRSFSNPLNYGKYLWKTNI
ncbi:YheC/YheD family protein [Natranaerobius trueperi]|uniref:ATP-grasp domain-containing protein n=1 Tax=Natranaerobius trueperi TaxID=759412 RepID=A0A226BUW9_9FIRM|nr:YheC/YheD family protein [Natranaerobius trueperi]OWZ82783.1 hypothetical protein CDO51_12260 [Natranaerobius trueperi]